MFRYMKLILLKGDWLWAGSRSRHFKL